VEPEPESIAAFRQALAAEFPDCPVEIVFQHALRLPFGPLTRTFVVFGDRVRAVTLTHGFVCSVPSHDPRFGEAVRRVAAAVRESPRPSLYLILDWVDGQISLRDQ